MRDAPSPGRLFFVPLRRNTLKKRKDWGGRIREFEHKDGGERVRLPRFAKFRSKNRKFVVSTSDGVHNGTFSSAFFLMKRGRNGPFPIPYGEKMGKKWGSFLSCISAIRQRVDHRDLLFEPPDVNTISQKCTFSRSKTGWRKKKRA